MFIIFNINFILFICAYVGIIINIKHYDKHLAELFLEREMFQIKFEVWLSLKLLSETFLCPRIIQRDVYHKCT